MLRYKLPVTGTNGVTRWGPIGMRCYIIELGALQRYTKKSIAENTRRTSGGISSFLPYVTVTVYYYF
jgi:hypothetical protein